jgi:hypothetical protein
LLEEVEGSFDHVAVLVGLGVEVHRSPSPLTASTTVSDLVVWFGDHRGDPTGAEQCPVPSR